MLDPSAITTIARQLWAARERLSLRTGGYLPTASELAIALRLYTTNEDRLRLERRQPHQALISSPDAPDASLLAKYLSIANAAYAQNESTQTEALAGLGLSEPVVSNLLAEKWSPGYFVSCEQASGTLFLAVRGSKEVSDFLTNLSAETERFLDGRGHQGVVKSGENLYQALWTSLLSTVEAFNIGRVVVVGHSLGGAVAAAMTMLLRESKDDATNARAVSVLKRAECFSFGGPPFLCGDIARRSDGYGITSLVNNLDLVPRLSAASVDRLLVKVSRYDWGGHMTDWVGRAIGTVASGLLPHESARGLSETVRRSGGPGLAAASQTIGDTARTLGGGAQAGGWWQAAMSATAAVGELVANGLRQNRRRLEAPEMGFAREFGMDEGDVARIVGDAPEEVFVAGEIWLLERVFTNAGNVQSGGEVGEGRLVRVQREALRDVEVSGWMVHDHEPAVMVDSLVGIAANSDRQ